MTNQIIVKMVLDAWHSKINETNSFLDILTDEQLKNEVAPGRNTGIYLLGHLTVTHDLMLQILGFGQQIYPQLTKTYNDNADAKSYSETASELRKYWKNINSILAENFGKLSAEAWFERHNSVSVEAFQKELHRNKLNIIISRTNHLSYHNGQLVFLKKQ
jgi:hypothetical protein